MTTKHGKYNKHAFNINWPIRDVTVVQEFSNMVGIRSNANGSKDTSREYIQQHALISSTFVPVILEE
jgi:predicted lactoylglutathione lyase